MGQGPAVQLSSSLGTLSNRRERTRTHGGVAGVSGRPLPYANQRPLKFGIPSI